MNTTYKLVELAKEKTGIESDYGVAKMLGVTRAMVSNWKTEKAEANVTNTLKLLKAAGLNIDDALKIISETEYSNEQQYRQAGFMSLSALTGMSIASFGALSLSKVSNLPYEAIGAWGSSALNLYIMLNSKLIKLSKIEGQLRTLSNQEMIKLTCANDIETYQVFTHRIY
jgi:predicted transcriptional regulator